MWDRTADTRSRMQSGGDVSTEVRRRLTQRSQVESSGDHALLFKRLWHVVPWIAYLAFRYWLAREDERPPWLLPFLCMIGVAIAAVGALEYRAHLQRQRRQLSELEVQRAIDSSAPCENCDAVFDKAAWFCPECGSFRRSGLVWALVVLLHLTFAGIVWYWASRS